MKFRSHLDPKSGSGLRIGTPDPNQIPLGGGMRTLTALVCL